ncbi:plasmid encoded RepA protein [mine drainage metagenome]|uniref:Plasmid encoded RepA protein n=1 Tax=mine drainage metagenome TaxID=410659 RepID=A0A1J5PJ79_9ZZZZ
MAKKQDTQDRRGLTKREMHQVDLLDELRGQDPDDRDVALVSQALALCPLPFRKPVGMKVERQVRIPGGVMEVVFTYTGKKSGGGLAYGNDAVLLDLLCSEARRTKNPEITFKKAYELLELLGIESDGGKDYRELKARLLRISNLHIHVERRGHVAVNLRVVDVTNMRTPSRKDIAKEKAGEHPILPYAIRLAPEFYADLMRNYVPIPNEVLLAFKGAPVEYSIAKFIIHRMRVSESESLIAWDEFQEERGSEDSNAKRFKVKVRNVLLKLQMVWPELSHSVSRERGGLRIRKPQGTLV